jgi:hypothetical protein
MSCRDAFPNKCKAPQPQVPLAQNSVVDETLQVDKAADLEQGLEHGDEAGRAGNEENGGGKEGGRERGGRRTVTGRVMWSCYATRSCYVPSV